MTLDETVARRAVQDALNLMVSEGAFTVEEVMVKIDIAIAQSVREFARLEDIDNERVDNFLRATKEST